MNKRPDKKPDNQKRKIKKYERLGAYFFNKKWFKRVKMLDFTLFILTCFVVSVFFIVVDSKTKIKLAHIKADSYVKGEKERALVYMGINKDRQYEHIEFVDKEDEEHTDKYIGV